MSEMKWRDIASSERGHRWPFHGKSTRKVRKYRCISRGCHSFLGGLGRTRPALRELSQQELSASPATVPYTRSLALRLYLFGGQNISSNCFSFLSSSWVATWGHAALSHLLIRAPKVHLCGFTASSFCLLRKAILGKPICYYIAWTTFIYPFKIHMLKS